MFCQKCEFQSESDFQIWPNLSLRDLTLEIFEFNKISKKRDEINVMKIEF